MTPRQVRHLFLASILVACVAPSANADERPAAEAGRQRASAQTRKAEITHQYAEVNGVRLHYAKAGNGRKVRQATEGPISAGRRWNEVRS